MRESQLLQTGELVHWENKYDRKPEAVHERNIKNGQKYKKDIESYMPFIHS